ncbi:MAG: Lrp/AsnC family transcriptional regulator [Ruminococcaceae bacterium]|nr:Lrp/AsnC family transcriptional regulator [Oscillospiraceae bacterium]
MDQIDKKILHILAGDAGVQTVEISRAINLSVPATNKRLSRLKKDGVITSYTVLTDGEKVGKPVSAFILVVLQYAQGVENFMDFVQAEADILECYAISGGYDYMLKVCAKDIKELEQLLLRVKGQNGVVKSQTMISLMEHKCKPCILPDLEDETDG